MISENMKILKEQYGFDTVAVREQAVDFSKIQGRKILDIGTGSGWMAIVLAKRGFEVVTIDIDAGPLQRAKETAQDEGVVDNIIFKKADATRLPFADNAFDAVFSFDSMHHLPDCYQAIEEMFRVCKASGWIVISDLNANGLKVIRQLLSDQGEKHDENPCRVDTVDQLIKKFDPQAQRADLEFVTVFVGRKCPQAAIVEI